MSTTKPRLDAATFEQLYTGRHSPPVLAALRAVLVDGVPMAKAARANGVSRSGLYRALEVHADSPHNLEAVAVMCPAHRAEQLRSLIGKQLAIWAAKDAEQTNPQPVGEPQP